MTSTCLKCKTTYTPKRTSSLYCSENCRKRYNEDVSDAKKKDAKPDAKKDAKDSDSEKTNDDKPKKDEKPADDKPKTESKDKDAPADSK